MVGSPCHDCVVRGGRPGTRWASPPGPGLSPGGLAPALPSPEDAVRLQGETWVARAREERAERLKYQESARREDDSSLGSTKSTTHGLTTKRLFSCGRGPSSRGSRRRRREPRGPHFALHHTARAPPCERSLFTPRAERKVL